MTGSGAVEVEATGAELSEVSIVLVTRRADGDEVEAVPPSSEMALAEDAERPEKAVTRLPTTVRRDRAACAERHRVRRWKLRYASPSVMYGFPVIAMGDDRRKSPCRPTPAAAGQRGSLGSTTRPVRTLFSRRAVDIASGWRRDHFAKSR